MEVNSEAFIQSKVHVQCMLYFIDYALLFKGIIHMYMYMYIAQRLKG